MSDIYNPKVKVLGHGELGDCLAAVGVEGRNVVFYTNRDYFPRLARAGQSFILAHELGHLFLASDDEQLCDAFALGLTAGRQPRSLKSAIAAVAAMHNVPAVRVAALLDLCRRVDKPNQSLKNNNS